MKCAVNICVAFIALKITLVSGWDQICREAIESTAMSAITYMRLRRLKVLLKGEDLVDYTWWADEVLKRIPESKPLHYQYQPEKGSKDFNLKCSNNLCLLAGIKYFYATLMNLGNPVQELENAKIEIPPLNYPRKVKFSAADCLKYLVVLLSDLHHPLHLDFEQPDSLSTIPVDLSEFPLWESVSMQTLNTKKPSYADFLKYIYMPKYIEVNENAWYGSWTHVSTLGLRYSTELDLFNKKTSDCFEVWAAETASLNNTLLEKDDYVETDHMGHSKAIKFTEQLDSKLGFLMRLQIVMAGARVGIVVNHILSHREIAYDEQTGLIIQRPQVDSTQKNVGYYVLMVVFVILILVLIIVLFLVLKNLLNQMSKSKGFMKRLFLSRKYQPVNKLPE
ncbi:bifunctional nuclease [Theileria orientalis strain Shintoku]|uniref:Bifunctional nuclease n=1 Tax=Theileria orientalis strain Shintoku TaxID=869250 RepID=J4DPU6_THEOR|nr:bifunctional nuclease [Theileria orientalis strain Shintoku]BAM41319.1 bifunctional nuclease [Theileria orientalis strain Shintoku]|eukprot:XP_009691620.1 bifunctional nuclease [Theileria orientalis strain Shintoku]